MKNINKIDQTQLKTLLRERVGNPTKFLNRPLVIWRSNWDDGIQERILQEVFSEINNLDDTAKQKWYRHTLLGEEAQIKYDLTESTEFGYDDKMASVGLLAVDPLFLTLDYKEDPKNLKNYCSLINNRKWKDIEVMDNVPVVVYMCHPDKELEKPELYPTAEQYVFEPDFDEWAHWAVQNEKCPKLLIDFIRGNGDKEGIRYRWYNFFNNQDPEGKKHITGCEFPKKWHYVFRELKDYPSIKEMTEDDLYNVIDLNGGMSKDVKEDLKQYIKNFQKL